MGLLNEQSRAPQLMVGDLCLPFPPSFPAHSLGSPRTPHFPGEGVCSCPSPSWGAANREAGVPWAGLYLESKGQGLECGPPLDPTFLTHPYPKQKASQPPFIPEVPVFTPICASVVGTTARREVNCPSCWLWPVIQGVCVVGVGTPWVGATSQGEQFLGALLRKACSSSSWRTPRSRKGERLGGHGEW